MRAEIGDIAGLLLLFTAFICGFVAAKVANYDWWLATWVVGAFVLQTIVIAVYMVSGER